MKNTKDPKFLKFMAMSYFIENIESMSRLSGKIKKDYLGISYNCKEGMELYEENLKYATELWGTDSPELKSFKNHTAETLVKVHKILVKSDK